MHSVDRVYVRAGGGSGWQAGHRGLCEDGPAGTGTDGCVRTSAGRLVQVGPCEGRGGAVVTGMTVKQAQRSLCEEHTGKLQ